MFTGDQTGTYVRRKKFEMNKKMSALVITGAFLVGGGVGSAAGAGTPQTITKTVTVAGPTITKTVEVPGPERVVTKTVEVKVPGPVTNKTPAVCLKALDFADQGFALAGDGMTAASEGFQAISDMDVNALESASSKISSVGDDLASVAPQYVSAKDACKSS